MADRPPDAAFAFAAAVLLLEPAATGCKPCGLPGAELEDVVEVEPLAFIFMPKPWNLAVSVDWGPIFMLIFIAQSRSA